jgi:polyisoprenoid-binding protein YceI
MTSTDFTQDLTLVNAGQSGADLDAVNIDFDWNGTAYANAVGALTYDQTHSPIGFEFAYRGKEADFFGAFSQLKKCKINFDVANPTAGTIDVVVDLASFDTRSPGGRDPRTTVADTPPFNPTTQFTEYGCIIYSTFGVITDSGTTPSDGTPQVISNSSRYVSFTSTSIAKLGDGYVAKGNMVFQGPRPGMTPAITTSVPIEMWFKQIPCWTNTSSTPNRRYWSLEGKFLMDAKNKWGITSSSLNDAIVRMQISIIAYKDI